MDRAAADKLGLLAFGELFASGMTGKMACRFRRAGELALGPLRIARPLFIEMSIGGLVRGAPTDSPIVGIIGQVPRLCAACESL